MPQSGVGCKGHSSTRMRVICLDAFLQEITLQYNLCNEPWLKYTMTAVSDRGLKPSQWTSAQLHSEVLYLETQRERFELSRMDASASSGNDAAPVSIPCNRAHSHRGYLAHKIALNWSNAEMHHSNMDGTRRCSCTLYCAHLACACCVLVKTIW